MSITEFLLARIAEDEANVKGHAFDYEVWDTGVTQCRHESHAKAGWSSTCWRAHVSARVLADCEAKRRIVTLHEAWPVLVETPPKVEQAGETASLTDVVFRMSQQMQWMSQQEYRERFMDEPPTAPILAALATVYADHPDCRDEWRI